MPIKQANIHYTTARKIIGAFALLGVAVVMTVIKGDVPPHLENFMEIIYFTFVLGNGMEYFTKLKQENKGVSNE